MSSAPLIAEIPYHEDSAVLFAPWADKDWAIFLDSGYPYSQQGRFDILAAEPYTKLITQGAITRIHTGNGVKLSMADPFLLLREALEPELTDTVANPQNLPFCGGALGYFAYDLGRRLETLPSIAQDAEHIPDMMMGLYDWAVIVDHQQQSSYLLGQGRDPLTLENWDKILQQFSQIPEDPDYETFCTTSPVSSNLSAESYADAFNTIMRYLREGDCYQVNLAQRFSARCQGHPWIAYQRLRKLNPAPFSAYFNTPEVQVCSSSPERFLKVSGTQVETKPIKGTRPRHPNPEQNRIEIEQLKNSLKDRAENLMIVDLMRNDISKSCRFDSVHVPELFAVESFATVHHLVSTIYGELDEPVHSLDLLRDCFPGGSITGAPKIRAMEIIEELEPHRRGIYCGSLGYISFDGNMDTNIAIRTLVHSQGSIRFWAGGGLVIDSEVEAEYQESFDKAAALLNLLEQMKPGTNRP